MRWSNCHLCVLRIGRVLAGCVIWLIFTKADMMIKVYPVKPQYANSSGYQVREGVILDDFNSLQEYTDYVMTQRDYVKLVTAMMIDEHNHVQNVSKQINLQGGVLIGWLHNSGRISLELVKCEKF
jgi:hypothetical protein